VLERAIPDLGAAMARRQAEGDIDPLAALRLPDNRDVENM